MMEEVQSKPIQPLENFSRVSETKQVALSSLRSRPSMICAVWGYADLHNFFAYQDRSPWNCQWELIWNLRKLLILWKAEKKYRRELSWSLMAPDQTVPEASPAQALSVMQTYAFLHSSSQFEFVFWLQCRRRLLRVPWTARRLNPSILKEVSPDYSLEGLMLKLQYFGHLMQRANSLEKTLILGKIEGKRRREWQRIRQFDSITNTMDMDLSKLW